METNYSLLTKFVTVLTEDAPGNAAGGGGIAAIGIPAGRHFGEPSPRANTHPQTFASHRVFKVNRKTFHECAQGKRKFVKYSDYVGVDGIGEDIRSYARSNPSAPVVVEDETTGAMCYLRYGALNPARMLSLFKY